jgi:tetratricopeptide (TPR) repeat protein
MMERRRRRAPGAHPTTIALAVLLAAVVPSGSIPAEPERLDDSLAAGVQDLHRGLHGRAERTFRAVSRSSPEDPEPPLLIAFSHWWRILEDRSDTSHDAPFAAALEEAVARCERRLRQAPDDARAMALLGTARIFKFHVEALRRNYRRAAAEARQGKDLLEEALHLDPTLADARFALGAYNYFADSVPALAKGLRAILRAPSGDGDLGLTQLRSVAEHGRRFRTDARLLLAIVCGSREERCYDEALGHLRKAKEENPGSPLIAASIGGLQMRLGRYAEAARSFEDALLAAGGPEEERAGQRRTLRIMMSEALVADWRLDEAEAALAVARRDLEALSLRERTTMARLSQEIALKRGEDHPRAEAPAPPEGSLPARIGDALRALDKGRRGDALDLLRAAAAAHPDHPLPRFLAGRVLLLEGRPAEADAELRTAADLADEPPPWMEGWNEIYRGMANRDMGKNRAARSHFRRAGEVRRFRSADRGLLELNEERGGAAGRCAL